VTSGSTLEHETNSLMDWATLSKKTKSHLSMTKRLTLQHVLIPDFNMDCLIELIKLLDRNLHVLELPLWVFAAIMADG